MDKVAHDRHGLPAAGVAVKTQAVSATTERGIPGDRFAAVHQDM
jgi:hypothetical protein